MAHYACIPIKIEGFKKDTLLSLNTATHPDYQRRGLFRELAALTYSHYAEDFSNVIGVANAKSTGGFLKHLGFVKLGSLELRIGRLCRENRGSRIYTREELDWRKSCPKKPLSLEEISANQFVVKSRLPFRLLNLSALVYSNDNAPYIPIRKTIGLTLDWRRGYEPRLRLPNALKPSPLNLIMKALNCEDISTLSSFSFPDFDAF